MTVQRALLMGRFQPPHRGHMAAIRAAARRYDRVFVGVGSAQHSHEPRNPLTVGERFELLQAALDELGIQNVALFPIPDIHRHARWVEHVEGLVPRFDVVVTNNPLTRRLFSRAGYRVVTGTLWKPDECSGQRIRALWTRGKDADPWLTAAVAKGLRRLDGPGRVRSLAMEARRG